MKIRGRFPLLVSMLLAAVFVVSACLGGGSPTSTPAASPTASPSAEPTATEPQPSPTITARDAQPTPTPFPTVTPTAAPTATPQPTATPRPTSTPRPTPTPSAAPTPTPEPFGEFTTFTTFTSDIYGFRVQYPEAWEPLEGNILLGTTLFVAQGELGLPRIVVDLSLASQVTDVKTQAEGALESLQAAVPDIEVLEEGPVQLADGVEAYEYDLLLGVGEIPLATKLLVAQRGGSVFKVFAQTVQGDFEGRRMELERIARSLELFSPSAFGVSREQALTLIQAGPSSLDPHIIGDAASYYYVVQIFGGLVGLDQDLNIVPDLAENWDVLDGGTTYVFHIRRDATFQSGKQVTAQDVKFSIERAADPATGSSTAQVYLNDIVGVTEKLAGTATGVRGVEVIDDFTVRFRISQPVVYFLAKLTHPAAFVVERDNVAQGVSWFFEPDGTGPFKLVGWQPGVAVVLERFQDYHRGAAKVPFVLVWNFGGPLAMFQSGQVDVANISVFDPDSLSIARDPERGFSDQLHVSPELTISYVGFNSRVEPFDDPRARLAFLLSLDVSSIISDVFDDAIGRAAGFIPEGLPGFDPGLQPTPFDPTRAKELWDEVLAEKGLELAEVRMLVSGISDVLVQMSSMWEEALGVEVTFSLANINDLRLAVEVSEAHMFDFGWIADYPDPQNFLDVLFHSRAANNFGVFTDAEVDALLEEARTEQDQDRRFELYRQAERLMVERAAAIPLWFQTNYVLVNPEVKDWSLSAQQVPDFLNVQLERPLAPRPTPTPAPPTATPGVVVATV